MANSTLPSNKRLKELFYYDQSTGIFIHKIAKKGRWEGTVAGYTRRDGYRVIRVDRARYLAHRLAWVFFYGVEPIDHIDHKNHIRNDNRIDNLRLANYSQNKCNSGISSNAKSGLKGVRYSYRDKCWRAEITTNNKWLYLGSFENKEDAALAYIAASKKFHGEYSYIDYRVTSGKRIRMILE
jgi:hypothetical protein